MFNKRNIYIFAFASMLTFSAALEAQAPASWPLLPRGVASFGGAADGGYLYIYGGHIGRPHDHSPTNIVGDFYRIDLAGNHQIELLPGGEALQGLALVHYKGKMIRIGGMAPRGESIQSKDAKETQYLYSSNSVKMYDPASNDWSDLPPLPEARSSHDAVVVGDILYVAGGWTLDGKDKHWLATAHRLDLTDIAKGWTRIADPIAPRRACATAAFDGKIFMIGGMDASARTLTSVDIYDIHKNTWSAGPALASDGFGAAIVATGEGLLASSRDGNVYILSPAGTEWKFYCKLTIPRMFHRLVVSKSGVVFAAGGAALDGEHVRIVEPLPDAAGGALASVTSWSVPFPGTAKSRPGILFDGNDIVLFGGNKTDLRRDYKKENLLNESYYFHVSSLRFDPAPSFPRAGQSFETLSVAGDGGALVAAGGFGNDENIARTLREIYIYNKKGRDFAVAGGKLVDGGLAHFGMCSYENALWIFGGLQFDGSKPDEQAFQYPTSISKFNPSEPASPIESLQNVRLPEARRSFAGALLGDQYFIVGGMTEGLDYANSSFAYDFATKTFANIPSPSRPRAGASLAALDGKLYLAGGQSPRAEGKRAFEPNSSIEVYDPILKKWSTVAGAVPAPPGQLKVFVMNGKLLFFALDPEQPGRAFVAIVNPRPAPASTGELR